MDNQCLFSKGFPTNRIPVTVPSTGQSIVLRETTITELKSICKTIIDNINRRQMDVIYDAVTEYLQAMILTDGVDVSSLTEFDRLYCLMVFFQVSFFKEPIDYKCPHCGVDIVYRYDMVRYLSKIPDAWVDDQTVTMNLKSRTYEAVLGWPKVSDMSMLMRHFYNDLGEVTEQMEQTQYGINFVLGFIKRITVSNSFDGSDKVSLDLSKVDSWADRMDCINSLPSQVVFDQTEGLFAKIMGYFVNRLENCFGSERCPQCGRDTYYGLSNSALFYSLFYGSLKSIYGFILQVECLCLFRYDCFIFDKEQYLTYNDLSNLMKQLSTTVEKDNKERQKGHRENFTKGLWYIREILNTMIFPEDKMKHH